MKVCIMCGGEGTRLRPLTFERPKPCIPIVNRPSIQHLVSHLSDLGFTDVVITLGYLGAAIEEALGDGSLFGVEITYVHEKTKLGTAGSVRNAREFLDGQDFLVVGGDHVTDIDLLEFYREHRRERPMVSIGLISIDDPSEYGIAEIDVSYTIRRFKEKPGPGEIFSNLASTGIYVCSPDIFSFIPPDTKFDFARDLFPLLMAEGHRLQAWLARGNWTDVGSPASLRQAQRWKLDELSFSSFMGDISITGGQITGPVMFGTAVTIGRNCRITGPVAIGSGTSIENDVLIGPYTSIGENCTIRSRAKIFSSHIHNGVTLGRDSTASGSIIDNGTRIGEFCSVENDTVIGPRVEIRDRSVIHSKTRIWPDVVVPKESVVSEHLLNDNYDTRTAGS
ncbi:MAG TPA: NDP-sugar synthase [Methanoregulaceae archaeon]|nr:NDP-sugar synthase [Methanoregulaceae archaeon]HPD10678.1 NDP-sugar synthase [Methanoregulaceae archaeon]HRT15807.1 NDP-sugar synthase [Methanoregulaceae archaeon]HRU31321.1 NDP-sugar synthase [Methanoregulaceae archaeon]